ncbi:DUF5813 family protein [Halobellus ruber]|uniref:Uncharacterized protein n=1 Tax=Halobellus ruber TaxID=2761102 RepID=A0A7J9SG59_9EURY|nr:DUF5813 family protein [Halobellus ruber]MBB6644957.1 hypothetical protein [Halobellus ruber]
MSESDAVERARRAAGANESFEPDGEGGYVVRTTAFEGSIEVDADGGAVVCTVAVAVPMLDAVTEEAVAPVVEEGWFETFELRIDDVDSAIRGDDAAVSVRQRDEEAVVEVELRDLDATRAVADAVAVVEYVEGTYVEGIIPGYEYAEPVTLLIQQAADTAGGTKGGTPL